MASGEITRPDEAGEGTSSVTAITVPVLLDGGQEAASQGDVGGNEESTQHPDNESADLDATLLAAAEDVDGVLDNDEAEDEAGSIDDDDEEEDDEYDSMDDLDTDDEEETCDHEPRPKRVKPIASLLHMAERGILKQLTKAIDGKQVTARYCCGGRVRTFPSDDAPSQDGKPKKVSRLTLRWDDAEDRKGRRIDFPFNHSVPGKFHSRIGILAARCRATGALNSSHFSIGFDPHSFGILDVISQILVPGSEILKGVPEHWGVVAKLSSLQVSLFSYSQDSRGMLILKRFAPQEGRQIYHLLLTDHLNTSAS